MWYKVKVRIMTPWGHLSRASQPDGHSAEQDWPRVALALGAALGTLEGAGGVLGMTNEVSEVQTAS